MKRTIAAIAASMALVACSAQATPTAAPAQPAAAPKPTIATVAVPAQGATASFAIVAEASEARYRVQEQLAGRPLPNDAVGTSKNVTGTIVIGTDGRPVPGSSKVSVDLTALESDSAQRDNAVKRMVLQTSQFPKAEFVATGVEGLPSPLPTNGEVRFRLLGDLTVRGVTKPVAWDVVANATGSQVAGTATTKVTFQDFGMEPPKLGPVIGVEDALTLELDFTAGRA